ncbi:MAG: hypothetical protein JWL62_1404, partial [Hyphomicrobiales bacterium]|nr:hypothetical protein [Hyphomicrobiales bacterium]
MRTMTLAVLLLAASAPTTDLYAQQIPTAPSEVAKPGGTIPGAP